MGQTKSGKFQIFFEPFPKAQYMYNFLGFMQYINKAFPQNPVLGQNHAYFASSQIM